MTTKLKAKSTMTAEQLMQALTLPEGFSARLDSETHGFTRTPKTYAVIVIEKAGDVEMRIVFGSEGAIAFNPNGETYEVIAYGHTSFETSKGRRTFDRTGVEDSFYIFETDTIAKINDTLQMQVTKIAESRARLLRSLTVPQIGHNVTPETLTEQIAKLKNKKTVSFHPAGFGTGYVVSTKATRFAKRASTELESFYDVRPLYVEEFDAD